MKRKKLLSKRKVKMVTQKEKKMPKNRKKERAKNRTSDKVLRLLNKRLSEKVVQMLLHMRKVIQDGENPDVPEYKCATCGHYRDGKCYREESEFVYKVNPFVNKCFVHTNYGASIHQFKLGVVKRDAS